MIETLISLLLFSALMFALLYQQYKKLGEDYDSLLSKDWSELKDLKKENDAYKIKVEDLEDEIGDLKLDIDDLKRAEEYWTSRDSQLTQFDHKFFMLVIEAQTSGDQEALRVFKKINEIRNPDDDID